MEILNIPLHKSDVNDDQVYALSLLKQVYGECLEVDNNHHLFRKRAESWLEFALVSFSYGDGDETYVHPVWSGCGSSGLRELRHSYFGHLDGDEKGYVFYLSMAAMRKAFDILSEDFDSNG